MDLCTQGHDVSVCGRSPSGACRECNRAAARRYYTRNRDRCLEAGRKWAAANPEKVRERDHKRRAANPERVREKDRKYRAANPEKVRAWIRKYNRKSAGMIGVPLIEAQPGHPCDCCGRPITKTPHADHDHTTGLFRGWLCERCNTGIACFYDDPARLASAQDYLARYDARFYQHDAPWPGWPGFD